MSHSNTAKIINNIYSNTETLSTTITPPSNVNQLVKAQLPNQQRTTVSTPDGSTIRDALEKALKLRKLDPDMCAVYKLDQTGQIKQRIDWDLDVSLLKGDEIIVETNMHMQLSHNFAKSYFILSKCDFCQEYLMRGIRCLSCKISFHNHCGNSVPKLCEPANGHNNNYHRRPLARSNMLKAHISDYDYDALNDLTRLVRQRAKSADENSRHRARLANAVCINDQSKPFKNNYNTPSQLVKTKHKRVSSGPQDDQKVVNGSNFSHRGHYQLLEEKWEIDGSQITRGPLIGQGSFATVHRGNWHGPVALKKLNVKNMTQEKLNDFKNEVAVLKKMRHPNILLFIGYVLRPEFIIVTQWCKGRSLYRHLHVDESRTFTNCDIKDIALGVAQGMEYLHAKHVIHRDLKSNNIFIFDEDNLTVKIGDFGLAMFKTRGEGGQQIYHPTGSILWMAPEIIRTRPGLNPFTFKSDVYSYGIVLYELLSRQLPYFDFNHKEALFFLIGLGDPKSSPKLNLDVIPRDKPNRLMSLMINCTEREADDRPQFTDIIRDLETIRLSNLRKSASEPLRLNDLDFLASQQNLFT